MIDPNIHTSRTQKPKIKSKNQNQISIAEQQILLRGSMEQRRHAAIIFPGVHIHRVLLLPEPLHWRHRGLFQQNKAGVYRRSTALAGAAQVCTHISVHWYWERSGWGYIQHSGALAIGVTPCFCLCFLGSRWVETKRLLRHVKIRRRPPLLMGHEGCCKTKVTRAETFWCRGYLSL